MRALAVGLVALVLGGVAAAAPPKTPTAVVEGTLGACASVDALGSLWVTSNVLGELYRISPFDEPHHRPRDGRDGPRAGSRTERARSG